MATLLTPDQVAARCGITKDTVYDWLRSGYLPGRKMGRLWRVDSDQLEAWIRDRSTGDQPPRPAAS